MMPGNKSSQNSSWVRITLKGILLFLCIDLIFAPLAPLPFIGKISAYNVIFPGRVRLPYGDNPDQSYNLSLYNLDAMFASHSLSAHAKPAGEYRVLLIGDSSVWGYLLKPEDTLSANLNHSGIKTKDGRTVTVYNLGYPTLSVTKDLLLLDYAMRYQPDLIIWLITLESLPLSKQLDSPIVQNNPSLVKETIQQYNLNLDINDPRFVMPNFLESTLVGERRALADIFRLQLYGVMWSATGIDQYYPATYEPPQKNLSLDLSFHGLKPTILNADNLSLDVLSAGKKAAGDVPLLFVNEPIYISNGENSDIRYNFFYPHWAYDQYRQLFNTMCQTESWLCLDEWNLVPADEFTNSAIHMSPIGTRSLSYEIEKSIVSLANP